MKTGKWIVVFALLAAEGAMAADVSIVPAADTYGPDQVVTLGWIFQRSATSTPGNST